MRSEPCPPGAFARGNARRGATRLRDARSSISAPMRHAGDAACSQIAAEKVRDDDRGVGRATTRSSPTTSRSSAEEGARARSFRQSRRRCGIPYRIARDAEVIAPIGVALALVRDSVERTIVAPSPPEIARIRREAADRVIAAGAAPERVEVEVEIDTQRNRVRATASGTTALVESAAALTITEDRAAGSRRRFDALRRRTSSNRSS